MFKIYFYKIFFSLFVSLITSAYFNLIDKFFENFLLLYKPDNIFVLYLLVALSGFLTNFYFQDLFKKRMRETCLINFMTYRLNFEIYRFK